MSKKKKVIIQSIYNLLKKISRLESLNQPFQRGGKHKDKRRKKRNNTVKDID